MESQLSFLGKVFRPWKARIIAGGALFIAFYQFACDQFGFPTIPNLWGMTGAAIPWWAWLLFAETGALYGIFDYVRRNVREPAVEATGPFDLAQLEVAAEAMPPKFAASPRDRSKWSPDIPLRAALSMYASRTGYPGRMRSSDAVLKELMIALFHNKVTAWGRGHPDDPNLVQIAPAFWNGAEATIKTNRAFSSMGGTAYDVTLSKEQMDLVWPRS